MLPLSASGTARGKGPGGPQMTTTTTTTRTTGAHALAIVPVLVALIVGGAALWAAVRLYVLAALQIAGAL